MKGSLAIRNPLEAYSIDMSVTPITNGAWVTLVAALKYGSSGFEIFNPSGTTMLIANGSAGNEVAQPYHILPGGSAFIIPFNKIHAGDRISIRAIPTDNTANTGFFTINSFG